jgi:phosphocarrier protein
MKQFTYAITDPIGIHARPAGMLAQLAKSFANSAVTLTKGDQTVKATQLMKLMNLGVKAGDEVTIGVEGGDEDAAIAALEAFFKENL